MAVLSRSSRRRLGHLQSHVDGGWHVCQAVFPEPQSAAARRRVEPSGVTVRMKLFRDFNLLAAGRWWNSWCLASVVCRVRSMRQATVMCIIDSQKQNVPVECHRFEELSTRNHGHRVKGSFTVDKGNVGRLIKLFRFFDDLTNCKHLFGWSSSEMF